jgi:serine/threonine protein kinase
MDPRLVNECKEPEPGLNGDPYDELRLRLLNRYPCDSLRARLFKKAWEFQATFKGRPFDLARAIVIVQLFVSFVVCICPPFWLFVVVLGFAAQLLPKTLPLAWRSDLEARLEPFKTTIIKSLTSWLFDWGFPKFEELALSRGLQFRYITYLAIFLVLQIFLSVAGIPGFDNHVDTSFEHATGRFLDSVWVGFALFLVLLGSFVFVGRNLRKSLNSPTRKSILARFSDSFWCALTSRQTLFWTVIAAYLGLATYASFHPGGVGDWFTNWIEFSLRDARLIGGEALAPAVSTCIQAVVAALIFFIPLPHVWKLAGILSSAVHRGQMDPRSANLYQALVSAVGVKTRKLIIRPERPWLRNIALSFWWLLFCYAVLFAVGMFYFQPQNWPFPHTAFHDIESLNLHTVPFALQVFESSVFALFGTAPFAVMSSAFLPNDKPSEIVINAEGLLFPGAFLGQLIFRPLRAWSDIKSVRLRKSKLFGEKIEIAFHSGGGISLSPNQLSTEDLDQLLTAIDEYSDSCSFDNALIEYRQKLPDPSRTRKFGDDQAIARRNPSKYKSTIFTPLANGDVIRNGTIRIVRQFSSRPLSAVYLVRIKSQLAVLKEFVVPTNSAEGSDVMLTFERECQLLQSLDHPKIVKVLETFQEGDHHYLLIEYANGQDLYTLACDNPITNEEVIIDWAKQICGIMEYLHSRDPVILHRDLSPDNIVLDQSGQLRLIDFGAANQFMEGVTGTLIGKQAYIAPEQLRGKATPQSDIYSFGGTLYYLLTGKEPKALAQCNLQHDGYNVSAKINDLIAACTEFEADKRPTSFSAILAMLSDSKNETSIAMNIENSPLAIGMKELESDSVVVSLKSSQKEPVDYRA